MKCRTSIWPSKWILLAVITAWSLLGYICICLAHLDVGINFYSSFADLLKFSQVGWRAVWTAIVKAVHIFSVVFNLSIVVLKLFRCWFLLYHKLLPQCKVCGTLNQMLIKHLHVFAFVYCFLCCCKSPSFCCWKAHNVLLPLPCHRWRGDDVRQVMNCTHFLPGFSLPQNEAKGRWPPVIFL